MFNHTVHSTFLCSASATQYLNPRSVMHWSLINKIWLFFTFLHDWISISCFPLFLKVHFIRFSSHFPVAHIYFLNELEKTFNVFIIITCTETFLYIFFRAIIKFFSFSVSMKELIFKSITSDSILDIFLQCCLKWSTFFIFNRVRLNNN